MKQDDRFRPKLGRPRGAKSELRYLQGVLHAVARAGGTVLAAQIRKRNFDGSRIGRGAGVGRVLADRHVAFRSRRVVIKARIVKIAGSGLKAAQLHLRYVQRDGVTREGRPGELYDRDGDQVDGKAFIARAEGDRHQFRFIVAAEDGEEYEDLKPVTRRLMARMEEDLGTKLDWVAVDHFNTGHPHTHIIVRGKEDRSQDLIIAREYISHGMRQRASEIVTLDLGPRTDLEIEQKRAQEKTQDRFTPIDRQLVWEAGEGGGMVRASLPSGREPAEQTWRAGRLRHLERLGLAKEIAPGQWQLSPETETTLRRMGERGDIIKSLHRALTQAKIERAPSDLAIFNPARPAGPLVGRLIERGLNDANGHHYMIVDGVDGRSHWVDTGPRDDTIEHIPLGSIVSVTPRATAPKPADRVIAEIAADNDGRYSATLHQARDPAASAAFIAAHVRRLEALRREELVEREADGSWHVPGNFREAVEARDKRQSREAPVAVDILSTARIDQLAAVDGATWLDRQLIGGEGEVAVRGFGFGSEVKAALKQRQQWLIERQLAEPQGDGIVYRANLLAVLRRRELSRVAAQVSRELGLPYTAFSGEKRIEGTYHRRLDLASARFAVIARARDFTLVPWRPVLDRSLGNAVAGIVKGGGISWEVGRRRPGPTVG